MRSIFTSLSLFSMRLTTFLLNLRFLIESFCFLLTETHIDFCLMRTFSQLLYADWGSFLSCLMLWQSFYLCVIVIQHSESLLHKMSQLKHLRFKNWYTLSSQTSHIACLNWVSYTECLQHHKYHLQYTVN